MIKMKQNLLKNDKNKRNVCLMDLMRKNTQHENLIYKYLLLFLFKSFILSFLGGYYEN